MSKEPKTAEQINTDKLLLWINRYLTRQFIHANPATLPDDECNKEAKVILEKCHEQIRQQLIEEIEKNSAVTDVYEDEHIICSERVIQELVRLMLNLGGNSSRGVNDE